MTKRYRICKNCEWYDRTIGIYHYCRYDSPQLSSELKHGDQPHTEENNFCSKWTPKDYHDNPAIKASWDEFKTLHILAMKHD